MEFHNAGYRRHVRPERELDLALESFWDGKMSPEELLTVATDLRSSVWKQMVSSMEINKLFDTNYHCIVAEFGPDGKFIHHEAVAEYKGAKAIHIHVYGNDFHNTISSIMYAVEDEIAIGKSSNYFYKEKVLHLPVYREGMKITTPTSTTATALLHIHMCYANNNFNDIIDSINDMDADLIIIDNSSRDIHSHSHSQPLPSTEEIARQINQRLSKFDTNILWVNPGYGLKTRKNTVVKPTLKKMVYGSAA